MSLTHSRVHHTAHSYSELFSVTGHLEKEGRMFFLAKNHHIKAQ